MEIGVCFGNNEDMDACGVCSGDSSCVDCAGMPNGQAFVDTCDVCAGGTTNYSPNSDRDECGKS